MSALKRKRATAPKFYAVRIGKTPGIYYDWDDCLQQVKGFPGAIFKSFGTLSEAQGFVRATTGIGANTQNPHKWYGVRVGRTPGVYSSWPKAQEQIVGWKAPSFRAFSSRADAEQFVAGTSSHGTPSNEKTESDGQMGDLEAEDKPKSTSKRAKTNKHGAAPMEDNINITLHENGEYTPGEAPLPEGTEDDFDIDIKLDPVNGTLRYKNAAERSLYKYEATEHRADAPIRIYTDGSSLGNGTSLAVSGVGVYFGPRDSRNISSPLPGTRQTNQRAELSAIMKALEVAPRHRKIIIYSDSNYAIKCVSEWFQRWRTNGWTNSAKKPVENRDLIQKIIVLLEERCRWRDDPRPRSTTTPEKAEESAPGQGYWNRGPAGVRFVWVKGHSDDPGNVAADALAVAAAKEARELLSDAMPT